MCDSHDENRSRQPSTRLSCATHMRTSVQIHRPATVRRRRLVLLALGALSVGSVVGSVGPGALKRTVGRLLGNRPESQLVIEPIGTEFAPSARPPLASEPTASPSPSSDEPGVRGRRPADELERAAASALAEGRLDQAARHYHSLASLRPDEPAFPRAAGILNAESRGRPGGWSREACRAP